MSDKAEDSEQSSIEIFLDMLDDGLEKPSVEKEMAL